MKFLALVILSFWITSSYSQTKINTPDFYCEIDELNQEILRVIKKPQNNLDISKIKIINVITVEYEGQFSKTLFLNNLYINNLSPVYLTKRKILKKKKIISSYSIILGAQGNPEKISDGQYTFFCDSSDFSIKVITELYLSGNLKYCFWISGTPLEVLFCVGMANIFILKEGVIYETREYIEKNWEEFSNGEIKPYKEIIPAR